MIHPTMRASDYRDQTAPLCRRPLLGLAWRMRELAQPPGSDFSVSLFMFCPLGPRIYWRPQGHRPTDCDESVDCWVGKSFLETLGCLLTRSRLG